MTVDYNQQRVLRKAISRAVIAALGGEDTPAYIDNHVRSKVYSECNHDVQDWFRVNSVGNIPRKRFDEARGVHPALEARHQHRDVDPADQRPDQLICCSRCPEEHHLREVC